VVKTLGKAVVQALAEVVDKEVDAVLVADEVVVEEFVGLVAGELPDAEVVRAVEGAPVDSDAAREGVVGEVVVV